MECLVAEGELQGKTKKTPRGQSREQVQARKGEKSTGLEAAAERRQNLAAKSASVWHWKECAAQQSSSILLGQILGRCVVTCSLATPSHYDGLSPLKQ